MLPPRRDGKSEQTKAPEGQRTTNPAPANRTRPAAKGPDLFDEYESYTRSEEDIKRRTETESEEREYRTFIKPGLPVFRPHTGDNQIRILPPVGTDWSQYMKYRDFCAKVTVHWGVGGNGGKKQTVICLARSVVFKPENYGNRCPICEERAILQARGDKEAVAELRYSDRYLAWVIDRKAGPDSPNPMLWGIPSSFYQNLKPLAVDRRTGDTIFVESVKEGRDIRFTYNPPAKGGRSSPKGNTTYVGLSIDPTPISLTAAEKPFLDFVKQHPLESCLDWQTYDSIYQTFRGEVPETGENFQELESGSGDPASDLDQFQNENDWLESGT